jgi:poly(3-hydroxybutyrate) depolymerase
MRDRGGRTRRVRAFLAAATVLLLWPSAGSADHDRIPDPAPRSTAARLPADLGLERGAVTVSGLSSGGYFAHQFHLAFSSLVNGAGIVAGGPYGCVETIASPYWPYPPLDWFSAALVACTRYSGDRYWGLRPAPPRAEDSLALVAEAWRRGDIDDPANLADDRVWLFRGERDEIVPAEAAAALKGLYEALDVRGARLRVETNDPRRLANHGMPVDRFLGDSRFPKRRCSEHEPPFIVECGQEAARLLLRHLRPGGFNDSPADPHAAGALAPFDQTEFFDRRDPGISLSGVGYVYVPAACRRGGGCRLHVAFHGCRQNVDARGPDRVNDDFVRDAGYNRWAAANGIVVLYPQTTASAPNPNRCWDFWGYTGPDYRTRRGPQMRAVKNMVDRLLGPPD